MLDFTLSVIDNFVDLIFAIVINDVIAMLSAYTTLTFTACAGAFIYVLAIAIKNREFLISNTKILMAGMFYALGDLLSE